jgi:hypothetical protein
MSKRQKNDSLSPEMRTALITGAVAILTAILASPVIIELLRREPPAPTPAISPVLLSVYNAHCLSQDFYVDGNLMTTVPSGAQVDIEANAGEHGVQACEAGTANCGNAYYAIWTQNAVWTIQSDAVCNPPVTAVTVTIVNANCADYDLYLDENYISTIYAGETQYFSIEPGWHTAKGCVAGTVLCSASTQEWASDAGWTIERDASCP